MSSRLFEGCTGSVSGRGERRRVCVGETSSPSNGGMSCPSSRRSWASTHGHARKFELRWRRMCKCVDSTPKRLRTVRMSVVSPACVTEVEGQAQHGLRARERRRIQGRQRRVSARTRVGSRRVSCVAVRPWWVTGGDAYATADAQHRIATNEVVRELVSRRERGNERWGYWLRY